MHLFDYIFSLKTLSALLGVFCIFSTTFAMDDAIFLEQVENISYEQLVFVETTDDVDTLYSASQNHGSYLSAAHRLMYAGFLGTASIHEGDPDFTAFRAAVSSFQESHGVSNTGYIDATTLALLNAIELPIATVDAPEDVFEPIIPTIVPAVVVLPAPTPLPTIEPAQEVSVPAAEVSPSTIPTTLPIKTSTADIALSILGAIGILGAIPGTAVQSSRLFTIVLFGRKKIHGVVYDSENKEPLDPVYVSVLSMATGSVVEVMNQITDTAGRFGFVLPKGVYKIVVQKTHYQFPSQKLAGNVSDEIYDNLYFGEPFEVFDEQHVVAMDIPMDKTGGDWNQEEKHRKNFLTFLMHGQTKYGWLFNAIFALGFFASILITYLNPVWWNVVMTALYIPIALLQVYGHSFINAGVITKNGAPLAHARIRVRNERGYEIMHKETSDQGNYYMLVPKGETYTLTVEEKNSDGVYNVVYTSAPFKASKGVINRTFDIT